MLRLGAAAIRRAAFFCLAVAVLNLYTSAAHAYGGSRAVLPSGELVTTASGVLVDDTPATSGRTFFTGSAFATGREARSLLYLSNLGRLELSADTLLKLNFSDSEMNGTLDAGVLRAHAPLGVTARFATPDAVVVTDAHQPVLLSIQFTGGKTNVSVQTGRAKISTVSGTRQVAAGESFESASGDAPPQAVPRQNLSSRERAGLLLGVAAAVVLITVILAGRDEAQIPPPEPCPIVISDLRGIPC